MDRTVRRFVRVLCVATLALFAGLAESQVEQVGAAEAKAARAVVEAQLAAFAADDAETAFSYAAPSIREMFGTPDRFMEMVRKGYPVVYRAASVSFLSPVRVQGQLLQGVQITDADGALWLATYRIERQADRSWRISGCDMQRSSGKMT